MIVLYNTLTKTKENFIPIDKEKIGLYLCGPTVYSTPHIGNARVSVIFDILHRLLKYKYGRVNFVRNYTDIDDKIISASNETNMPISILTNKNIIKYMEAMHYLGVISPTHTPRATDHIPEMISIIQKLISFGYAYVNDGHVLFETKLWHSFGPLSGRDLLVDEAESRLIDSSYKNNPEDFVLWKPSLDDEPGWESPWGRGRPGWHIECSAMARKFLGDTFDIHGGGSDLIFPHHENENAQTCAACSVDRMANYWIHTGMLTVNGQKMSKSLGNIITVDDLKERGVSGAAIRLTFLKTHYRSNLDWTDENLEASRKILTQWARELEGVKPSKKIDTNIMLAITDDLNTPQIIHRLYTLYGNRDLDKLASALRFLGIDYAYEENTTEIQELIDLRNTARKNEDWMSSDELRDKIISKGYEVKDYIDLSEYHKKLLF